MSCELVTFGEAMIRFSPPGFSRLEQATSLRVDVGGAELNVAVAAQRLGLSASYVTRLVANALGRMVTSRAGEHGVDTSHVVWTKDDRVGLYFTEFGAAPRPNSVLYDRTGSAMARIRRGEIDWGSIFRGVRIFHTSGITPALSPSAADATREAIQRAKKAHVKVSIDLNYRARLWSQEQARRVMTELTEAADILITTEEDTKRVFGIEGADYEEVARSLAARFRLEAVAITLRETPSVWRNTWTAIVLDAAGVVHRAPVYDLELVDRVGGGDAFAGGFLYGYLTGDAKRAVDYGVAVSALKQTTPGDFSWVTRDDAETLLTSPDLRIVR